MKDRARQRLKKNRNEDAENPWRNVRPMDAPEVENATRAILDILKGHVDGLHYGDLSPEEAILEKVIDRQSYGDPYRQRLVFRSIMDELGRRKVIKLDTESQYLNLNHDSFAK